MKLPKRRDVSCRDVSSCAIGFDLIAIPANFAF
jgi:hypothetical protein